jgi:hypothetical protein
VQIRDVGIRDNVDIRLAREAREDGVAEHGRLYRRLGHFPGVSDLVREECPQLRRRDAPDRRRHADDRSRRI